MGLLAILGLVGAAIAGAFTALAKKYQFGPWLPRPQEIDSFPQPLPDTPTSPKTPLPAPITPKPMPTTTEPVQSQINPDITYSWDSPQHNYHNVRVLCDQAGLTLEQKNLICSCVYQESEFHNSATHANAHSTDWGLVQINDRIWCGPGEPFTDAADIVNHPDKAVNFMIHMFKVGKLDLWVSYKSGAYQQWLLPTSPMWKLDMT